MARYDPTNSKILQTTSGKKFYRGKLYPTIPASETDVYVITTVGDRLDLLANSYYKDPTLWWIIAVANNNITNGSIFPVPGTQLRIPVDVNSVLNLFDEMNNF